MKIVIVNGQGGSGKDTFEAMIEEECNNRNLTCKKFSIIDYTKECAQRAGLWSGEKDLLSRKFLANFKDIIDEYNDGNFNYILRSICENENSDLIFVDIRDPNDIDRLKNLYPEAITVLIIRYKDKIYGNHADDNVLNYLYDYVIENTGTLEMLRDSALTFLENNYAEKL